MNSIPPRPQTIYRDRLLHALEALAPARVLEVGCGGGCFLRAARTLGVDLIGVDPDRESVAALKQEGFDVKAGCAERLDWADDAFDVAVFCYTAHHIEDWNRALLEAIRVSRRAVLVLDPWYEAGIPSQAVAEDFDRWCKRADRATGMVHNDCLSATDLLAPVRHRLPAFQIGIQTMLTLHELGIERMQEIARTQLARCARPEALSTALESIMERARLDGFSDDGAVLLSLAKREA